MLHFAAVGILLPAWLPMAYWIFCLVAATRVWLWQGTWPSYGHPDPKDLPQHFGPVPEWLECVVPLASFVALIAISILAMRWMLPRRWWLWASVLTWALAWVVTYGIMLADLGGAVEWFSD
jgi:hypothetical protein